MMDRRRRAAQEALVAFWTVVAEHFPDIKTGDFPPELDLRQREEAEYFIEKWVKINSEETGDPAIWNYVFHLCFSMEMPHSPEDFDNNPSLMLQVSSEDIQEAILQRVNDLVANDELHEAIGPPEDGYRADEYTTLEKHHFTFGNSQEHAGKYVVIWAKNGNDARERMFERYGRNWSMHYPENKWVQDDGTTLADKWGWEELR